MTGIANTILKLAGIGVAELFQETIIGGAAPALLAKVGNYFKSTNVLSDYYNRSVKRSILSLEIALKGPRAYYPQREKEFYQKHFMRFEQRVFRPFSLQAISERLVKTEEELRDKCIEECDQIKRTGLQILVLKSLSVEEQQRFINQVSAVDDNISQKMLSYLERKTGCRLMLRMLEKENVLLNGIVFHFHTFLQSDPNLSNYSSYLETTAIKKTLMTLQKQMNVQSDSKLVVRIQRMEKLLASISCYENSMGAIGQKLDRIYKKTVQTYEVLMRLEQQMKSSFNVMEERLDMIQQLLMQKMSPPAATHIPMQIASESTSVAEAKKKPLSLETKPLPPESIKKEEKPPLAKALQNFQEKTLPEQKKSRSPEQLPVSVPHKHIFNVMPSQNVFSLDSSASEQPSLDEGRPEVVSALEMYSAFLEESEVEEAPSQGVDALSDVFPAFSGTEEMVEEKSSQQKPMITTQTPPFPQIETQQTQSTSIDSTDKASKKSKRRRADKISNIFGDG